MVIKMLTGHAHYRSACETDSDCGNCDGARCDSCNALYYVHTLGSDYIFTNKEEADRIDKLVDEQPYYTLRLENNLVMIGTLELTKDNIGEDLYNEIYNNLNASRIKYNNCKCTNKATESCGDYCYCDDARCYYEMVNIGRTEKKWYM